MKPLTILELALLASNELKIHQSMGSVFHGALMEIIDSDYADYLHTMQLRPYSQYLYFDKERGQWFWRLAGLNKQANEQILQKLSGLHGIYLRHKQCEVKFGQMTTLASCDYEELLDNHFAHTEYNRFLKFEFLSPTSFKSDGEYMIYPTPRLILGSLLNKWNSCSEVKLEENNLLENLSGESYVVNYSLFMQRFSVEGSFIPAFKGGITLGLKNNIMANRIIRLLADFANFSGLGIKTALGMGGVGVKLL